MTAAPLLRLDGVTVEFPGVRALDGASLTVLPGEVHALVGENGAGKSTLMAVAAGEIRPGAGSVELRGQPLERTNPGEIRERGVAFVHQHPALLPDLTVVENLYLGVPRAKRPPISQATGWARRELARLEIELPLGTRCGRLGVVERHFLEIAKALIAEPSLLILDEPTEPLRAADVERLFDRVREMAGRGTGVIYISHRIPEVLAIADRITVLRDGQVRGTLEAEGEGERGILNLIVGRDIKGVFPAKNGTAAGAAVCRVAGLSGSGFDGVSTSFAAGEIVGLAGVEGNGQREFMRALAGHGTSTGAVELDGGGASVRSPRAARRGGIVYLPGDRQRESLLPRLNVRENAALTTLGRYAVAGVTRPGREREAVAESIEALRVKTPSTETPVSSLSGGNQQKVALTRALLDRPAVLLADEPTNGVDVGARIEIYGILRRASEAGAAVVVLSSDGPELEGLCDRVLVFSRGRVVKELRGEEVSEAAITEAALTSVGTRAEAKERRQRRLSRLIAGDYFPACVLALVFAALAAYTGAHSDTYFTTTNWSGFLLLAAALGFVALGQMAVIIVGGIDLSVGPLIGLLVVIASFQMTGSGPIAMACFVFLFLVCGAVGAVNGGLVRGARIAPVIATLVTYFVLQGIALLLRPTPDGFIDSEVAEAIQSKVGFVPVAFLVLVAVTLALELWLRRTRGGFELRAVGSDEVVARRLGIAADRVQVLAYVACALLTCLGALLALAQLGVGDATAGNSYTLTSIAAVVLGGASIFGGRGAFVGAFCGALLIQQITNVTTFLSLSSAWQYWLFGLLTLIAAGFYSQTVKNNSQEER